ncbi:hypothetical protein J6590_002763 [Homalodisca vitripennis]|nr:hypothetical protein J6590_002763 [Homalodisca vitripennis]
MTTIKSSLTIRNIISVGVDTNITGVGVSAALGLIRSSNVGRDQTLDGSRRRDPVLESSPLVLSLVPQSASQHFYFQRGLQFTRLCETGLRFITFHPVQAAVAVSEVTSNSIEATHTILTSLDT